MTRYCVQITRTYEVQAEDVEDAVVAAGEVDDTDERYEQEATVNVTDLDEVERAGRPIEVEPGMCPYPINGKLTARECREAGQCGCQSRDQPGDRQ